MIYHNAKEWKLNCLALGIRDASGLIIDSIDRFRSSLLSCDMQPAAMVWARYGEGPGESSNFKPSKWGVFSRKYAALKDESIDHIRRVSVAYGVKPSETPELNASVFVTIDVENRALFVASLPAVAGMAANESERLFHSMCAAMHACVGYVGIRPPIQGRGRPDSRQSEMMQNDARAIEHYNKYHHTMLVELGTEVLLSESHLASTMGRSATSLRDWILEKPAERGDLVTAGEERWRWRLPAQRLPEIREELFRAGRLYYWRFFNTFNRREEFETRAPGPDDDWKEPEPYYRPDVSAPWEAGEEIPDIYKASVYREMMDNVWNLDEVKM